jgi:tetratricopeptide (TPR) repeat protein
MRLAELFRGWRTLLILDGLEPLQYPTGQKGQRKAGQLKDQALRGLLLGLAEPSPKGMLTVITTRISVDDLAGLPMVSSTIPLMHLNDADGGQLLSTMGVAGSEAELRAAARAFGGHALALSLLGSYLRTAFADHDVRHWREVDLLVEDEMQGGHARRVIRSYEKWLGANSAQLDVLRILSLFDRPADPNALAALRAKPGIPGLTDVVTTFTDQEWHRTLKNLDTLGLLSFTDSPAGPHTPGIDTHALIREHFESALRSKKPEAWCAGHDRLYEYFKTAVPQLPNERKEVMTLFQAMAHACAAGRYEDALKAIYEQRVVQLQTYRYLSTTKLGLYEPGLAALSNFYSETWKRPVEELKPADKALVLHETGVHLVGVGRLAESLVPFDRAVELFQLENSWAWASVSARYLGELQAILGDLRQAKDWAEKNIGFAERAGDYFERMADLTSLGDALHLGGDLTGAETVFLKAEQVRDENGNQIPNSYFFWGLGYCDLLLTLGRVREAFARAESALK